MVGLFRRKEISDKNLTIEERSKYIDKITLMIGVFEEQHMRRRVAIAKETSKQILPKNMFLVKDQRRKSELEIKSVDDLLYLKNRLIQNTLTEEDLPMLNLYISKKASLF